MKRFPDPTQCKTQNETALRSDPMNAAVRYNFALALGRAGDVDAAQRQLEAALESAPNLADAHELLANLLMARGQAADALPHYRAWVALRPESAQAQFGLGSALAMIGSGRRPFRIYRKPLLWATPPPANLRCGSCANWVLSAE